MAPKTVQVGVHELIETLLFFQERDASVVARNRGHQGERGRDRLRGAGGRGDRLYRAQLCIGTGQ